MQSSTRIKDIMVDIFTYPHVPYWFTLGQTIKIIKVSFISTKTYPQPLAILVFDEHYNLLGTLTLGEIMRGLEPRFLKTPPEKAQVVAEHDSELALIWDTLFTQESKERSNRQVSEFMVPARHFVDPDDPISKAAYLMIHHNLTLLPVLENNKKFVGLVRMVEVFDELTKSL